MTNLVIIFLRIWQIETLTLASVASHPNPKRPSLHLHQRRRSSQIQIDSLHPSVPTSMNSLAEKQCGNCSFKDRWLLHYLRIRGEYRRLCTSCVLKLHPASFCPVCFNLFESSVPQHDRVTCQKCQSITHLNCCVPNSDKPHTCPPCANPSFRYFDLKRNGEGQFEIDLKHAKALRCAAQIAADSLTRAVHMAETDAVRKVKEAVASKKRAREGLQDICAKEKARKVRDDSS